MDANGAKDAMSKVTVEEPKTVVEETEMYECDNCGGRFEQDEVATVKIHRDERVHLEDEKLHLCDNGEDACTNLSHAYKLREQRSSRKERIEWRWNALTNVSVNYVLPILTFGIGATGAYFVEKTQFGDALTVGSLLLYFVFCVVLGIGIEKDADHYI